MAVWHGEDLDGCGGCVREAFRGSPAIERFEYATRKAYAVPFFPRLDEALLGLFSRTLLELRYTLGMIQSDA